MFAIYVISLSSSERRESIAKVLTERAAAFRFEDAIDGRELTDAQVNDICDEEAARDTILNGLAASGWHTAAIAMRLAITAGLTAAGSRQ